MKQRQHDSVLLEAEKLVHGDRNEAYGHPLDDFKRTALMWSAILGVEVPPYKVGLCMAAVKISRECNKPKRDNMVDLAGYAETVAWAHDEQAWRDTILETFSKDLVEEEPPSRLNLEISWPATDKYLVNKLWAENISNQIEGQRFDYTYEEFEDRLPINTVVVYGSPYTPEAAKKQLLKNNLAGYQVEVGLREDTLQVIA